MSNGNFYNWEAIAAAAIANLVFVFMMVVWAASNYELGLKRGFFAALSRDKELVNRLQVQTVDKPVDKFLPSQVLYDLVLEGNQILISKNSIRVINDQNGKSAYAEMFEDGTFEEAILRASANYKGERVQRYPYLYPDYEFYVSPDSFYKK